MIEVKNLTKSFEDKTVLFDINATFDTGKTNLIIGQSGSGKTVLMKNIVGLLRPTTGEVLYDGRNFVNMSKKEQTALRREMGMIFQGSALFDSLSVLENVVASCYFGHAAARNEHEARERAMDILQFTGLYEKRHILSKDMGTPDQKRLEMARALATKPELLFLDENMAGLNPAETEAAIELIRQINRSGVTIFLIEHIMQAVVSLCESVIVLHHGEKIAEGTPEQVMNDPYVMEVYLGTKGGAAHA